MGGDTVRGKTRYIKFLKTFENKHCVCGETEPEVLSWYPHHTTIHSNYLRSGPKTIERNQANDLIVKSKVVCKNCAGRIEHARILNEELPFNLKGR
jgi:hypothetical protein